MWLAVCVIALITQLIPATMGFKYGRPGKAIIYMITLPVVWFVALELVSGHLLLMPAIFLLAYPAPWAFLLHAMKMRREQLAAVAETQSMAP
jgi:hypothetical protein